MKRSAQESATRSHIFWMSVCIVLLLSSALGVSAFAQNDRAPAEQRAETRAALRNASEAPVVRPNYELAARFVPSSVSTLVFDTEVKPHWFELSDRFWYSYETPEGTHYWIVDPVRKTKTPLFDNAKVAAQLSTLTNYPYDAQHLPIKALRLVKQDTALQFDVEVRKDSVIPNETKKAQADEEENIQEDKHQQGQQQMGQRKNDQQGGENAEGGEAKPPIRTIYFELELATGKVTRLDGMDAPLKKSMWASVSPDGKTIVFARGYNLLHDGCRKLRESPEKARR